MRLAILAVAVLLAGCGEESRDDPLENRLKRDRIENPAGRYAMLPAQDTEAVYVLDTTDGSIRLCRPKGEQGGMICGPASPQ